MPPSVSAASSAKERFNRMLEENESARRFVGDARVQAAFDLAESLYGESRHWSGLSCIDHALAVLQVFLAFEPDEDAVIACLLQSVLEAKAWTLGDLERQFGLTVRSIVSGVHLLSHVTTRNSRMTLENMRLMFLRVSDDVRVVLLILCKRRALLDHLDMLPAPERSRLCRDVLQLFSPVAARLGIYTLKHQLESRAFPFVYPTDAARIEEQLAEIRTENGRFLDETARNLRSYLRGEGVSARVEIREKQPYSIFRKMRQKSVTHVQDLYDLFALRVIVESDIACYQVLGLLHRIGHPVAHRFKDYIAFPKPNGYQSLHTTLAHLPGAPDWVFVEVQVRTEVMHREAEYGIAAHWSYKEGGGVEHDMVRRAQLHRVLSQRSSETTGEAALMDHIFVLTPRGDVVELPEGATPLDFAFHLHTDLGLSFRAAKVNGGIVPLNYQLENGDIVEIVKHREPHPSPRWLSLLKTAGAKSRLKRYLSIQQRPLHLAKGRGAVNAELAHHGMEPLDQDLTLLRRIDDEMLDVTHREDLLAHVGQGTLRPAALLSRIEELKPLLAPKVRKAKALKPANAPRQIVSDIPMPIRHARCCKPDLLPGCAITGIIARGGRVNVHRVGCKMLRNANPERVVGVRWE
jgi:GTP diphosphokinase / guanosine-3',5'-bis(diphosphate) 3'-diphosphatase